MATSFSIEGIDVEEISLSAALQSAIVRAKHGETNIETLTITTCRGPKGGTICIRSGKGKLIEIREDDETAINERYQRGQIIKHALVRRLKI